MSQKISLPKRKTMLFLATIVLVLTLNLQAFAHFQMILPSIDVLEDEDNKTIELQLIFTHPSEASHTMDMEMPRKFGVYHQGRHKDLTSTLEQIEFANAKAWKTSYQIRGLGDFVFYLKPQPYWEPIDDTYITQITKIVVNSMGVPTDWDVELGLEAEIVPLTRPYGLWSGNVFQGIVKQNGVAVPFAEIEIEHLNAEAFSGLNDSQYRFPTSAHPTQIIKADQNGVFTFGIPKAGWWGFAALLEGEQIQGQSQELGAVMWIKAYDI